MARIQILELPDEEGDDGKITTPFALIIDGYDGPTNEHVANGFSEFRNLCGARAILVTEETIDIPGLTPEEIAAYGPRSRVGTALVDIVPDFSGTEAAIREGFAAIGPQKIRVHVGDREITDIVRTELAENNRGIVDALGDRRG